MNEAKMWLYGIMVTCFFVAGAFDLYDRQWKLGVVSLGFGLMNAVIFFWR